MDVEKSIGLFLQSQAGGWCPRRKFQRASCLIDDTKQKSLPDVGEKYCLIPLYATGMAIGVDSGQNNAATTAATRRLVTDVITMPIKKPRK